MQFADLRLAEPILRALVSEKYLTATPVQAQAIPPALEGKDVIACAQTGTGKTAAFALPTLQRLTGPNRPVAGAVKGARCLVLAPTRELATQIADGFRAYGKNLQIKLTTVFGGVGQNPQVDALRRGVDVVVATPGRLMDLMQQGHVDLRNIEVFVLDEADRMLDMGFINDIRKIVAKLPKEKQVLLFSATMPTEIRRLADSLMKQPVTIQIAPVSSTVELIDQSVYMVEKRNKPQLLAHLVNDLPMSRAIVFTRTKHGADRVVSHLHKAGIRAEAIHGNKSQNARQRALDNFKRSKIPVLVATDIASRGIDVDDVSHVVNYDLTHEPETYVHRIGRTGRAGAAGFAVSFCDAEERSNLRAIERLIRKPIPVKTNHPEYKAVAVSHERDDDRDERRERGGHRHADRREPSHVHRSEHQPRNGGDRRPQHSGGPRTEQQFAPRPARQDNTGGGRPAPSLAPSLAPRHPAARPASHPPRKGGAVGGGVRPTGAVARNPGRAPTPTPHRKGGARPQGNRSR